MKVKDIVLPGAIVFLVIVIGIMLFFLLNQYAEVSYLKAKLDICNDNMLNITQEYEKLYEYSLNQSKQIEDLIILNQDLTYEKQNLTIELSNCHIIKFNESREKGLPGFENFEPVEENCRRWVLLEMFDCNTSESCMELGYRFCLPYLANNIYCPSNVVGKYIWEYKSNLTKFDYCLNKRNITCLNETAHNIQYNGLMYNLNCSYCLGICAMPNFNFTELMTAQRYLNLNEGE